MQFKPWFAAVCMIFSTGAMAAQVDLIALTDVPSESFGPAVINKSGEVYAVYNSDPASIIFQDGSGSTPNQIVVIGDSFSGGVLTAIDFNNPLAPVFLGNDVLANVQIMAATGTTAGQLIIMSSTGAVIHSISTNDPGLASGLQNSFGLPFAVDFGGLGSRTSKGPVVSDFGVGGFTAPDGASFDTPTSPFVVTFMNNGALNVTTPDLGHNPAFNDTFDFGSSGSGWCSLGGTPNDFDVGYSAPCGGSLIEPANTDAGCRRYGANMRFSDLTGSFAGIPTVDVVGQRQSINDLGDMFTPDGVGVPGAAPDDFILIDNTQVFESECVSESFQVFAGLTEEVGGMAVPPTQIGGIASDAVSSTKPPKGCDAAACGRADLDGDGDVDKDDVSIAGKCYFGAKKIGADGGKCKDVDGNKGKTFELNDYQCVVYCKNNSPRGSRGLDPDLTNPNTGIVFLAQGDPLPGFPDLTVDGFFAVRGGISGVSVFGVFTSDLAQLPGSAVVAFADEGLQTVLRTGTDLGDGEITSIARVGNVNDKGQFPVGVQLDGSLKDAVYRIGASVRPNSVGDAFRLFE